MKMQSPTKQSTQEPAEDGNDGHSSVGHGWLRYGDAATRALEEKAGMEEDQLVVGDAKRCSGTETC